MKNITKKTIKNIAYQIEEYLSKNNSESTFQLEFVPFFIDCLSYFSKNFVDPEIEALIAVEQYWIDETIDDKGLKEARSKFLAYQGGIAHEDRNRRFYTSGIMSLLYPYIGTDKEESTSMWLIISAILQAGMPNDYLYNKLEEQFASIIDLDEASAPAYVDLDNKYQLMDYSLYSEAFGMNYSRLLLRSPKSKERKHNIDILIFSPTKLIIPTSFNGIEIEQLDEDDDTIMFLKKNFNFNTAVFIFALKTEGQAYYVNAAFVGVYHNKLNEKESSIDRYTLEGRGELVFSI